MAPNAGPAVMPMLAWSGMRAEALVVDDGLDGARPRVVGDAVARQVLVRAGGAVARDRAHHDLRVELLEPVVAEAHLGEEAGTHRLDDDVGAAHEVLEHRDAVGLLEVEHERLLAPVHVEVEQRRVPVERPRHLAAVVARGRLDLDDLGAEVDEVRRDRGRTEQRALDHPHAVEHRRVCRRTSALMRATPPTASRCTRADRSRRRRDRCRSS